MVSLLIPTRQDNQIPFSSPLYLYSFAFIHDLFQPKMTLDLMKQRFYKPFCFKLLLCIRKFVAQVC